MAKKLDARHSLYLSKELKELAQKEADRRSMTLNAFIIQALFEKLESIGKIKE
jgi:hypothetical protein